MSDLELQYPDLTAEVGRYLGWETPDAREQAIIERTVNSGIRQYMFPLNPDTGLTHKWSFLKHIEMTVSLIAAQNTYELPAIFNGVSGSFSYENGCKVDVWPVDAVIKCYHEYPNAIGDPEAVALYPEQSTESGASWNLMVYPTPSRAIDLVCSSSQFNATLPDSTNGHLPGGPVHSEGYLESCLAVAELRVNDMAGGPHKQAFTEILRANIAQDFHIGPRRLGSLLEPDQGQSTGYKRSSIIVEYVEP